MTTAAETATEAPAPPAEVPKAEARGTTYVVLKEVGPAGSGDWEVVGEGSASSAKAAVRAAFEAGDEEAQLPAGRYVAVPTRSWSPIAVKSETKTQLVFG